MAEKAVSFRLRGRHYSLTRSNVEEAVKHATPGDVGTYSVTVAGKEYPPKQILALALRVSPSEFISTDATRTLKKLGFEIRRHQDKETVIKTESEELLEAYLFSHGLIEFEFEPVLEGCAQKPDYLLHVGDREILLEVKQFEATAADYRLGTRQYDPYGPIREKVAAGRKKFKDLEGHLCCLVLYNREKPLVSLDWQYVYGAMLGNMAFRVPFDPARGLLSDQSETGFFGGGGKMIHYPKGQSAKPLEPHNSTISAILVLQQMPVGKRRFDIVMKRRQQELGCRLTFDEHFEMMNKSRGTERDVSLTQLRVVVCENPYARIPLPREVFRGPYDETYGPDEATRSRIMRLFAGEQIVQLESEEEPEEPPMRRIIEENRTRQELATKHKTTA
ncbi:MAG: hypothetical protein ACLQOO_33195 [Terriglobia bacterium]